MPGRTNGFTTEQSEALAALGATLLLVQSAEHMIKFCMQLVLQRDGEGLTYEILKDQERAEAKKTLGYFLVQLRQRVELAPEFDEQLREFLELRNTLAHNLADVPGVGFSKPHELPAAKAWCLRLAGLANHVLNVFAGLARAWQRQVGLPDLMGDHEVFQKIDAEFSPLVDQMFTAKDPAG